MAGSFRTDLNSSNSSEENKLVNTLKKAKETLLLSTMSAVKMANEITQSESDSEEFNQWDITKQEKAKELATKYYEGRMLPDDYEKVEFYVHLLGALNYGMAQKNLDQCHYEILKNAIPTLLSTVSSQCPKVAEIIQSIPMPTVEVKEETKEKAELVQRPRSNSQGSVSISATMFECPTTKTTEKKQNHRL